MAEFDRRADGALCGIRVVELGSYIAGPTAGRLLAAFGAEVIKVERPIGGDELRRWGPCDASASLLWRSLGRNKKSVTVDIRRPEGRDLVLGLVRRSDVLLECFRPGVLDRLGLGKSVLTEANPRLIVAHVSGFGQDGPYRDRAGFGSVAEGFGGIRHLTGFPDRPPSRMGVSLGDSVAGLYAAIGILLALIRRGREPWPPPGEPAEEVDVALYEAVYSLLDTVLAEYDMFGAVRERTGTSIPGVAPSNTYRCADGGYVVVGANGDNVFRRLGVAMGRPDLPDDPAFNTAGARGARATELDRIIEDWTLTLDSSAVLKILDDAGVPATRICDARDIASDPHYEYRGMHERHQLTTPSGGCQEVRFPAAVPRMARHPAVQGVTAPELGANNVEVLEQLLGVPPDEILRLEEMGVV